MSVVSSLDTYLILSRGCSADSESGIRPRVNYVSKISSAFGTRYIFSYVPGTSYPFMPVATYRSTVRWQSEHQLGHHYRNATIPCVKEARWVRHEAQDSIVLSMSNDLLCSGAQHDTHTYIPGLEAITAPPPSTNNIKLFLTTRLLPSLQFLQKLLKNSPR
jgi:hypothetical protein